MRRMSFVWLAGTAAPARHVRMVATGDSRVVCERCTIAATPLARMRGLMWKAKLGDREGLLCRPTNAIHTFWMRFAIDAVFLDGDGCVLKIVESLPRRRFAAARGARAVLELPTGRAAAARVRVGERLEIV
jgi:hypothetical protein